MPRGIYVRTFKLSIETRAKMSAAKKGRPISDAARFARIGRALSDEHRANISAALKGKRISDQHRANISAAKIRHREECQDNSCAFCFPRNPSSLSWKLIDFLVAAGFDPIVAEQRFGRYVVDAYLPEEHLAFEADGEYWHTCVETKWPGYYAQRDAYLRSRYGLPVVHLTGADIKHFLR